MRFRRITHKRPKEKASWRKLNPEDAFSLCLNYNLDTLVCGSILDGRFGYVVPGPSIIHIGIMPLGGSEVPKILPDVVPNHLHCHYQLIAT